MEANRSRAGCEDIKKKEGGGRVRLQSDETAKLEDFEYLMSKFQNNGMVKM